MNQGKVRIGKLDCNAEWLDGYIEGNNESRGIALANERINS